MSAALAGGNGVPPEAAVGREDGVAPSVLARSLERHSTRTVRPRPAGVILLDSGDPDGDPPDAVRAAIEEAVRARLSHYGDPFGDPDLRDAIAAKISRRHAAGIEADRVLVTHGAGAALAAAMAATVNPGDGVIVLDPCYSIFPDIAELVGAQPIRVPHSTDLHLDLDRIAAAADTARAIIVCNPCSPTGVVYRRDELEALVALADRHDLVILSDEVYDEIVFTESQFTSLLDVDDADHRLIYVQSFSKTYAMAGYRLGYLVPPRSIFNACARIHRTINGCISPALQRGALAALHVEQEWIANRCREYQHRRDLVFEHLAELPTIKEVTAEAGLFAWVRYSGETHSSELAKQALTHGVAVRPGAEFGASGESHLAISLSIGGEALETGLLRLAETLTAEPSPHQQTTIGSTHPQEVEHPTSSDT